MHPRPTALAVAGLLAACGGGGGQAPSQLPPEGDALILQQVLDGRLDPHAGLLAVAHAGGWPIATSQGFLFAIEDGGLGPYRLEAEGSAFPATALRSEAGVAWAIVPVASPEGVRYGYRSRFGDPVSDRWARRIAYAGGTTVPLVRGAPGPHVERWPEVGDGVVGARTLVVWVPADPPDRALYAHDGQNLFDPAAPFAGWRLDLAAGPATLVVGISNTPDRILDYTPVADDLGGGPIGGGAAAYADFVHDTVRPFVEARYGPVPTVGLIGSSLGGLVAWYQALRHPGAWDFAASLSGTMGWGSIGPAVHHQTLIEAWGALTACPAGAWYLDSGGGPGSGCVDCDADGIMDDAPDAADNYCENVQLKAAVEALGCGAQLTYRWAPNAGHNEAAWKARSVGILDLFESL
jgi:hypothetical protein